MYVIVYPVNVCFACSLSWCNCFRRWKHCSLPIQQQMNLLLLHELIPPRRHNSLTRSRSTWLAPTTPKSKCVFCPHLVSSNFLSTTLLFSLVFTLIQFFVKSCYPLFLPPNLILIVIDSIFLFLLLRPPLFSPISLASSSLFFCLYCFFSSSSLDLVSCMPP